MKRHNRNRKSYSYKQKLAGTMFSFFLVPIILIGCLALFFSVQEQWQRADADLNEIQLDYQQRIGLTLSATNEKMRYITNYNGVTSLLSLSHKLQMSDMVDAVGQITDVVDSIFYESDGARFILLTNNPYVPQGQYLAQMTEEEVNSCIGVESFGRIQCVITAEEEPMLRIERRFLINGASSNFNMIRVDIPLRRVLEHMPDNPDIFTVYIPDDSQEIIPISDCTEEELLTAQSWLNNNSNPNLRFCAYNVGFLRGTVYSFLDTHHTIGTSLRIGLLILCAVGAILLLAYYLVHYTVGKLTGRLMTMISTINSEDLKFTDDLLDEQYDEFDIIQNRLIHLKDELRKENDRLLKLEFETLNHKLSPHYLYNNLSAIKWKCDNEEIDRIVDTMVRYYRNMFQKGQSFNPVAFETGNLQEYVELLKFSYESEFVYESRIDPELMQYRIPANIIQPLVENAFLHGINNNDAVSGCILLQVFREDSSILIRITDNGNRPLAAPKKDVSSCTIIDRRLKLYFGEEYGLTYRQQDGLTVAEIEMPFLKEMMYDESDRSG